MENNFKMYIMNADKFLFLVLLCFSLLLSSCAEESNTLYSGHETQDYVRVILDINLPVDMQSRAGTPGDAVFTNVNSLYWTVFEVVKVQDTESNHIHVCDFNSFAFPSSNQTSETIYLKLAKGKKYQVAIMAKYDVSKFTSFSKGHLIVDYTQTEMYNINGDVFVGKSNIIIPEEGISDAVTLSRPFAQINWGTSDLETTAVKDIKSIVNNKVTFGSASNNIYQDLDILTGKVSNPITKDISCTKSAISNYDSYTFPKVVSNKTTYSLISSSYILTVQDAGTTISTKTEFSKALSAEVVVDNVPVQANYRTNIYGALLTEPNIFDIEVSKGFQNFNNIPVQ